MPAAVGMVLLLAGSGPAGAADVGPPAPGTVASPTPTLSQRLKLGPYRSVHADDPAALVPQPRFEEHVEVRGKAMDAQSLTMKLDWWLKDTDPTRGPVPASMTAPSIQEMHDYRPHGGDAVNLLPVMQWLSDKLGGKKKP